MLVDALDSNSCTPILVDLHPQRRETVDDNVRLTTIKHVIQLYRIMYHLIAHHVLRIHRM